MTSRLYGECLNCMKDTCGDCPILEDIKREGGAVVGEVVKKRAGVKSDGGSSSYYTFIRDDGSTMETEEVIRCLVDNDFDLGNIIKAARRISEDQAGRGKMGSPARYDWMKIKYSAEKRIALLEANDKERDK